MAIFVHSSDLHINDRAAPRTDGGFDGLHAVLGKARTLKADAVLLAGDTFDNHRISTPVLQEAADFIAGAGMPVLILPGNHDPIMPECLFRRAGLTQRESVFIFGVEGRDRVEFAELDVEILGFPHIGMRDSTPVGPLPPRKRRWQIVMAHGHYVPPDEWLEQSHRSWRMSDELIAETKADYLALGHWDRATQVGDGRVPAYYSGSPDLAQTVNVIRIDRQTGVAVSREDIPMMAD